MPANFLGKHRKLLREDVAGDLVAMDISVRRLEFLASISIHRQRNTDRVPCFFDVAFEAIPLPGPIFLRCPMLENMSAFGELLPIEIVWRTL